MITRFKVLEEKNPRRISPARAKLSTACAAISCSSSSSPLCYIPCLWSRCLSAAFVPSPFRSTLPGSESKEGISYNSPVEILWCISATRFRARRTVAFRRTQFAAAAPAAVVSERWCDRRSWKLCRSSWRRPQKRARCQNKAGRSRQECRKMLPSSSFRRRG